VTVLVLQSFPVECGAARGGAEQKALRANIPRQPQSNPQCAGTRTSSSRYRRAPCSARGLRTPCPPPTNDAIAPASVMPSSRNLPVLGLVVVEQRPFIHRLVKLPFRRIDSNLAEQRVQAEGARLVGNNRPRSAVRWSCCESAGSAAGRIPLWWTSPSVRTRAATRQRHPASALPAPGRHNTPRQKTAQSACAVSIDTAARGSRAPAEKNGVSAISSSLTGMPNRARNSRSFLFR